MVVLDAWARTSLISKVTIGFPMLNRFWVLMGVVVDG